MRSQVVEFRQWTTASVSLTKQGQELMLQVPTYCFVTGRSVGIGAYTARLSHRIVQARSSHIILTGAAALNTVLGKEVYTSNNQLGGTQIMYNNGVTHAVVDDDFEGVMKFIHWMSYLPNVVRRLITRILYAFFFLDVFSTYSPQAYLEKFNLKNERA